MQNAHDLITQLAQFNPDPALQKWFGELIAQTQQHLEHAQHAIQELTQQTQTLIENNQQLSAQAEQDARQRAADAERIRNDGIKIDALIFELAHYRRIRFGRTSENMTAAQRELFQESLDTDISAIQTEIETLTAQKDETPKQRVRAGRQPLPDHLPRIEHRHEPESCACGQCGHALVKVREDITEQLDVEPARFFVRRHIRPQYACRHCQTMVAAPIPAAIVDGGMAAPGLYAWLTIQKFQDHLPLYRIEQIAARQQVPLARSTLTEWIGAVGVALQPLADRLAELLRQRTILHVDETPVPQLDPGKGKTKRAYLWAYHSQASDTGPPLLVFDYQTSRSGRHAQAFLQHWRGHLMVDDYVGYKALFALGVTELACWAHVRRKFFDLHAANGDSVAAQALEKIGELYAIERAAAALDVAAREQLRRTQALPKQAALHAWLLAVREEVAPGCALAKAIDYSLRRWPALQRYAQTGDLPIDNNPVENAIRPIAIGKKNWLFAGSERAGRRAAAIQSLLGTAKLNGIEPFAWLRDTLEKLPSWPHSRLDALLPLRASAGLSTLQV